MNPPPGLTSPGPPLGQNGNWIEGTTSRLESFRQSDRERDAFCQDVLDRLRHLQRLYDEKCGDYEHERNSRRMYQGECEKHAREKASIRRDADANPFVLVLSDGDGIIFEEQYLKNGASGGSEAAHDLYNALRLHMEENIEGSRPWKIIVMMYANFDGLSRKLASVGMLSYPSELSGFASSFSLSQPMFHFVDVGRGKERADHKIKEMFNLFVWNIHCKHIFFGGCHDNGYLPNLEPYKREERVHRRTTLIESTPAESGYHALGYPIARFPSIFRMSPLPERRTSSNPLHPGLPLEISYRTANGGSSSHIANRQYEADASPPMSNGTPVQPTYPAMPGVGPPAKVAVPVAAPTASPTPTLAENIAPTNINALRAASSSITKSPAPSTYATVGGTVQDGKISLISEKPTQAPRRCIFLNAEDQRIDPRLPKPDTMAINSLDNRIKRNKICNNYHLLGRCGNPKCDYTHAERIPYQEQLALRHKARERACPRGSYCRNTDCLSGHMCPRDRCQYESCFFDDLHDLDTTVKMKMYEDGSIELVKS